MQKRHGKIQAGQSPKKPESLQVTYETASSRRLIHIQAPNEQKTESAPHGAGSFHDPEHHFELMERVNQLYKK